MKILITGAKGFIGKNLTATLNGIKTGMDKSFNITDDITIYEYDLDSKKELLDMYCSDCDFVYHLAGVNRPKTEDEFMKGNHDFILELLESLASHHNTCPIMLSSSIQAELDNAYGRSKKAGEDLFFEYGKKMNSSVMVYRFPNVFGKWCRPGYNSAIATFCHNIANDLPIQVNNRESVLNLVYIDDVISELIMALRGQENRISSGFCQVKTVYTITLGDVVDHIYSFKKSRGNLLVPDMSENGFVKKLYATYLSYLPKGSFNYPLKMNVDNRGSFTEILRTSERGQFSVNISKPGITKGNHWHHTKNEKFVVVSGKGLIRFRQYESEEIIEYHVSGDKIEVIDIPTGYTHSIVNQGDTDLVTFMWCSECFDPKHPDTYFLEV